jgi:phosphotriesterase-related protein
MIDAQIQTVRGAIPASALGVTLGHEHLRFRDDAVAAQWPRRYDDDGDYESAVEMAEIAKRHGVQAIVDPTAMNAGRDVAFMARVSERSGVHVVACTGIYTFDGLPFYFENRSTDVMADHFIDDIRVGVQGTGIRAAFIKTAADLPGITSGVEKVHRAAARASLATGAPIMAHSCPEAGNGPKQLEIFADEGVDLSRVQICHYGDTTDLDAIRELLDTGAYVGLDRYGSPDPPHTPERNATTAALIRAGYIDQLIISHDYCGYIDWFPADELAAFLAESEVSHLKLSFIFTKVLPWLRDEGLLDDAAFERLFVANPRRWLIGA